MAVADEPKDAGDVIGAKPDGQAAETAPRKTKAAARRAKAAGSRAKAGGAAAEAGGGAAAPARPGHVRVTLREDIEKLGKMGEAVEVRAGYARNYLLPMGLAYVSGPDAEKRIAAETRRRALRDKKRAEDLHGLAQKLTGVSINVTAKADGENLYGSVGPKDIAAAILAEHKAAIPESAVVLAEHIKKIGVYDVPLKLAPGAETTIKVWVVAE